LASKYFNRYFKHKNFASFRKQLNLYGFQTSQPDKTNDLICYHRLFKRDGESRLHEIVRSSNANNNAMGGGGVASRPNKRAAVSQQPGAVPGLGPPGALIMEKGTLGGKCIQEIIEAAVKEEMEKFKKELFQNQNHPFRENLRQLMKEELALLNRGRGAPNYGPFLPGRPKNQNTTDEVNSGDGYSNGGPHIHTSYPFSHSTPMRQTESSPIGLSLKNIPGSISSSVDGAPLVRSKSNDSKGSAPFMGGLAALASEADRRLDLKGPKQQHPKLVLSRPLPAQLEKKPPPVVPPPQSSKDSMPCAPKIAVDPRLQHARRVQVLNANRGGVCCSASSFVENGAYRLDKEFWCVTFAPFSKSNVTHPLSILKDLEVRVGDMRVKRFGGENQTPPKGFIARSGPEQSMRHDGSFSSQPTFSNGWGCVVFCFQDKSWIKIRVGPFRDEQTFLDRVGLYRDPGAMYSCLCDDLTRIQPDLGVQIVEVSFHKLDIVTMMFLA
jgi:hypothetical protein